MRQLQSLYLYDLDGDLESVQIIANHKATNQRIQSLYVENIGDTLYEQFTASVSASKYVKFPKLYTEHGREPPQKSQIKRIIEMCGSVQAFSCFDDNSGIELAVLQAIGPQLQYLDLNVYVDGAPAALKLHYDKN